MKYVAILEPTDTGFSVYVPDLPGCVSSGRTREAAARNIREAITLHVESLRAHHEPVPASQTIAIEVEASPHRAQSA